MGGTNTTHCRGTDAHHEESSVRMPGQDALGHGKLVFAQSEVARVDIDDQDLAPVAGFDLRANLLIVE
jgi:hypothetical protein